MALYMVPTTITFDDSSAMVSQFCWNWSPFYIGQTYTYTTEDAVYTFNIDLIGNLRKFTAAGSTSTYDYLTTSTYNSFVSPTLIYQTDLTTYIAA